MGIKPIKKVNVGEQVFEQLQNLLVTGEWEPGDKIPSENDLADMFHVSRMTVRQALQKLVAMGLIETRFGEGSFVRKVEVEDNMNALIPMLYLDRGSNLQVFEFRAIIDAEAAGLAAERATGEDIERLEEILEDMRKCQKKEDCYQFAIKDLEYHLVIGEMTRNNLVIQTNRILKRILMQSMNDVIDKMGCEPALHYHTMILDAIKNRDKEEAMRLMREHIHANVSYFDE